MCKKRGTSGLERGGYGKKKKKQDMQLSVWDAHLESISIGVMGPAALADPHFVPRPKITNEKKTSQNACGSYHSTGFCGYGLEDLMVYGSIAMA